MSRVGNHPITVPSGVEIKIQSDSVVAKGPKGELSAPLFDGIKVSHEGERLTVACDNLGDKRTKSYFGLVRALIANNITGVSKGFERTLELRGVGYRAQAQGSKLTLSLGFSHPVEYQVPEGVEVKVDQSRIIVSGRDKQQVGQVASEIRAYRPPEPYKGKGVRYLDERVVMKEGKKA
ncbi:MAG TPA: 50S ribosomal protein L6 [Mariprofundaceae bacterium]|nr:50S ribosomal protein L6 [Mariprofundaceae bacterium]